MGRHYKNEIFNRTKVHKIRLKIRLRFLSFARKCDDKYGKKLMNTATKTGIDTAKTASKLVVQKPAEATGDLIGNKIADKITSLGKTKSKEKKMKDK